MRARQSPRHQVLSFPAEAADVLRFATIERVGRDEKGQLSGFQRPQIAAHIREIHDYLESEAAVLPNPIVIAFTSGVRVQEGPGCTCTVEIVVGDDGPPGQVVDGQQRLMALSQLGQGKEFEVFVSALVCEDEAELRRQFVLINNTRPLPKSLVYELLPHVEGGLPKRLSDRALAADLAARLNWEKGSPLEGKVHQHTNPGGVVNDTALQKVVLNSLSGGGAMRDLSRRQNGTDLCYRVLAEYFWAVQVTFPRAAWDRHTAKTSRLVHGAGIIAMGHVMDLLYQVDGADACDGFRKGLACLTECTAWTQGEWDFGGGDVRHWQAVQNTSRDIAALSQHLVAVVRGAIRARRAAELSEAPLFAGLAAGAASE